MISFLTSLKPCQGAAAENQYRALRSWRQVHPAAEILVYGACPGLESLPADLGLQHVPQIAYAASGVPLFNAIAAHAAAAARYDRQIYLNGDILMHRTLLAAADRLHARFPRYVAVGQRVDLGPGQVLDPHAAGAARALLALGAAGTARLHSPAAKDYFLFPRGVWEHLPAPVVIGRGGYDSALLVHCLGAGIPLVDATAAIPALHPCHDYRHVPGGLETVNAGADADAMIRRHGLRHSQPTVADCGWVLLDGTVRREPCRGDHLRRLELWLRFRCRLGAPALAVRALWRLLHPAGQQRARWGLEDIAATMAAADGCA